MLLWGAPFPGRVGQVCLRNLAKLGPTHEPGNSVPPWFLLSVPALTLLTMYCNPEVWVKSTFPPPACFWLERVFITAREIIIEHRDPRRGMINTEWFDFLWGALSLTYPRWRLLGLSRDNYWYPSLRWWTRGSDWLGNIYCSEGRGWMDCQRTGTTEDIQLHLL